MRGCFFDLHCIFMTNVLTIIVIVIIISGVKAVNPTGIPGTHPHQYFGWRGRQWEYPHQYYYVLSDIADQY